MCELIGAWTGVCLFVSGGIVGYVWGKSVSEERLAEQRRSIVEALSRHILGDAE